MPHSAKWAEKKYTFIGTSKVPILAYYFDILLFFHTACPMYVYA